MKLRIETWTGRAISLNVDPEESIETVMKMVAMQCQLPSDQQMLTLDGKQIPDGTLMEYGITESRVLQLVRSVRRPLFGNIFVQTVSGKLIECKVHGQTTVQELKQMIKSSERIDAARQRLVFANRDLQDGRKLSDYGIQNEDIIQLRMPIAEESLKLQVKLPSGRTVTFPASSCKTVRDLKQNIEHYEGISFERQHVHFEDQELPNNAAVNELPSNENVIVISLKPLEWIQHVSFSNRLLLKFARLVPSYVHTRIPTRSYLLVFAKLA